MFPASQNAKIIPGLWLDRGKLNLPSAVAETGSDPQSYSANIALHGTTSAISSIFVDPLVVRQEEDICLI